VQRAAYAEDRPRAALLSVVALLALGAGVAAGTQLVPREQTSASSTRTSALESAATATLGPAATAPGVGTSHAAVGTDAAAAAPSDTGEPRAAPAPEREPEPAPEAEREPEPEPAPAPEPTRQPAPVLDHELAPEPEVAVAPDAPATAPRPDPSPHAGPHTLLTGRVAYLRCDGLSTRRGPFPCPRDRTFERGVWHALRTLERCALLTPGPLELRVEIVGAHAPSFDLRAADRERARTARACVDPMLASAHTTLTPERMVVSFAFELADAPR